MTDQIPPIPPVPLIPAPAPAPAGDKKGLAIASLVLGILSFCSTIFWYCSAPMAIVGLILGFLGLKSSGRTMATVGMVLAGIGFLLAIVFAIISFTSGPIIQQKILEIQSTLVPSGY